MKKYLIYIIVLFGFVLFPNIAHASVYKYQLYSNSDQLLYESTNVTDQSINVTGVRKVRFYFNNPIQANNIYNVNFKLELARSDGVNPQFPNTPIFVVGSSVQNASQTVVNIEQQQQGAQTFYRALTLEYNFTSNATNNGQNEYWQGVFGSDARLTFFSVSQFNVSMVGTDSSAGTEAIINNQNANTEAIIDSQEDIKDSIDDLNDTLQDTTISDTTIGDKVGDISSISETPITDLLTMPLTLLSAIFNGMDGSCSPYTLPFTLWGNTSQNVVLPCFNGATYFGSAWSIIDGLFCLFMLYNIGMMVVQFFENITSLRDTFDDMYVPQHTYHPKHGGGS